MEILRKKVAERNYSILTWTKKKEMVNKEPAHPMQKQSPHEPATTALHFSVLILQSPGLFPFEGLISTSKLVVYMHKVQKSDKSLGLKTKKKSEAIA